MTLFLGILIAGSVAAYTASRHCVFAAGGGDNGPCPPCPNCVFTYCFWVSGTTTVFGQVDDWEGDPVQNAYTAGAGTIYTGLTCDQAEQPDGSMIDLVEYTSCTGDCIPSLPPAEGVYTGSDGQGESEPYDTVAGSICING